jgi:SAM-dependent methyltransferase
MKTFSKKPAETSKTYFACELCGNEEYMHLWEFDGWAFVKCSVCGLVCQNPRPPAGQLLNRYDGEYFDYEIANEDGFYNLMELGLRDSGFYLLEKELFSHRNSGAALPVFLDVGCATGLLLYQIRKRGWAVKGVEVCRPAAEYGITKRGLDIAVAPLETAGIPDNSIDVMHCSHLIEHLTSPDAFLKEAARIIKPGGHLIIVTPDVSGFQARLFGARWRSAIADHMFLFSKKTLRAILRENGFSIEKTVTWGGLAAGTAPVLVKKAADRLVKVLGKGDVVCIMSAI